jgi:hypothetical protein
MSSSKCAVCNKSVYAMELAKAVGKQESIQIYDNWQRNEY